ncbi:MAG: Gfo/Idh/MocA family protein [Bryobacteraceae bacterium]
MNRRTFLQSVSAGAMLPAADEAAETGMIGIGGRGSLLLHHALSIPGVRIGHLCDIEPGALDKALSTAARDRPKGYQDYRKLLEAASVDTVIIATPCHLHKEMILAALQAGKNVYCEKPMALTPEDNRAIVEAAAKAKGILQLGFQRRYSQPTREMVGKFHNGEMGKVLFARGQYYTPKDLPHRLPWKFKRETFGDMIVEQAVHQFDLYNWVFQGHPLRACGFGGANYYVNDPPGRTIMDHYTISYEYPHGVHLNFSHIYYAIGDFARTSDTIIGAKGAASLVLNRELLYYDREANKVVRQAPMNKDNDESTHNALTDFFACARRKQQPFAGAAVGRLAALTVIMGLRAMVEGRVVEWKEVDL